MVVKLGSKHGYHSNVTGEVTFVPWMWKRAPLPVRCNAGKPRESL